MTGNAHLFENLRAHFQQFTPPVIIFNKSHSGSRLLAELVEAGGFFLGAHQNDSRDSVDVLELVEYLVCNYYPDYSPLWRNFSPPDFRLAELIKKTFDAHLEGHSAGKPWGWKLCETAYIVPVLDFLFPDHATSIFFAMEGMSLLVITPPPAHPSGKKSILIRTAFAHGERSGSAVQTTKNAVIFLMPCTGSIV